MNHLGDAQWLDLARIPQFRQDYYTAHGPKDLNALYKRMREVSAYLREDAAALEALVGQAVLLDSPGTQPYRSVHTSTRAHPAKAGAAKPRVLASSVMLNS